MNKKVPCLLLSILILSLTGCWNNRDLTELSVVTAVAIDKAENNDIELTVQIVKAESLKTTESGSGGSSNNKPYVNISSTGVTMFDAVRNLLATASNRPFYSHVQLMVISDEMLKTNIDEFLDLFERNSETRRRADLLIAKGLKAKTVLESESSQVKFPSEHDVESLKANEAYGKTPQITLVDYLKANKKKGYGIVIPVIYNTKGTEENFTHEDLKIEGGAIIKKGVLVGFLNPIQARGYLFINNELKSTIINLPGIADPDKKLSLEVVRSSGKVKAKLNGDKPELSVEVDAEGDIGEVQGKEDITKPEVINKLEKEAEKEILRELTDVINVAQSNYKTDIFGFCNELNRNYYKEWKRIEDNWDNIYSRTSIKLKVKFKINRQGLINKSINSK